MRRTRISYRRDLSTPRLYRYAPTMYIVFSVVYLALVVFALVDVLTSNDGQVKHLPKIGWVILIVLLPLIGSIVWLIAGKDRALPTMRRPEPTPLQSLSTTEQELAALDAEIEFHEKQEKLRRLEAELQRRKGTSQG